MLNLYEAVRGNPSYSKLEIGEFLFAEYTCGVAVKRLANWTPTDYLVHVISGRKTWHTPDGTWQANPGDTWFFKKGATTVEQHFEAEMCLLMLFIPDELVRGTVRELSPGLNLKTAGSGPGKTALRVHNDMALAAFFQSMRAYLSAKQKLPEPLVRLKFKELLISVLTSPANSELAEHFRRIAATDAPSIAEVMEANFRSHLTLDEYARLCHRSLASFKRQFQAQFAESPGKWLWRRRLNYSAALLANSQMNVTEIAFESGFEDLSHFSRAFKTCFGVPPLAYREEISTAA